MSFLEVDWVREQDLPPHLADGKRGDRVSLLEGGLLHVKDGRASFVRWSDVLGVVQHGGAVQLLVPRTPPAPPWLEVEPEMVGGGPDALRTFVDRVQNRGGMAVGGYRDALRTRRQNLAPQQLLGKVAAREAVPGALEVPSTIMLGVSYPGLAFTQVCIVGLGMVLGYVGFTISMLGLRTGSDGSFAMLFGYALLFACMLGGGYAAVLVGRAWREAKNRTLPRQRVLVLAPDGCIVGFRTGVRALAWSEVQSFGIDQDLETFDDALVVTGTDGKRLGDVAAGWLDAPLGLVVRVAEAYRQSARDE
jgi:hypothetical protein